jgi:U4/U6 small nuclear ribonucleoprotein PRP4
LEGSQYGDSRALSCICHQKVSSDTTIVATGSWTGSLKLWDGDSPVLSKLAEKTLCHEDRIMGIAIQSTELDSAMVATTSIDTTAKLWKVRRTNKVTDDIVDSDATHQASTKDQTSTWTINEISTLRGHAARLCRVAFHPMKHHVATTSFDHSWRLWDVETSQIVGGKNYHQQEILLQDGHCREVYEIGFHPDGSLWSTTDFSGIIQLWDLRTGKAILLNRVFVLTSVSYLAVL